MNLARVTQGGKIGYSRSVWQLGPLEPSLDGYMRHSTRARAVAVVSLRKRNGIREKASAVKDGDDPIGGGAIDLDMIGVGRNSVER